MLVKAKDLAQGDFIVDYEAKARQVRDDGRYIWVALDRAVASRAKGKPSSTKLLQYHPAVEVEVTRNE